jgi:hypothetical protein
MNWTRIALATVCVLIHFSTRMEANERQFLLTKGELFATAAQNREAGVAFAQQLEKALPKELSRARAISFDGDIEQAFSGAERSGRLAAARKELRERFGFDRLASDPTAIAQRVLKRGRIANDQEAEVVRDFVANQANEEAIGAESFARLAEILDEAGY